MVTSGALEGALARATVFLRTSLFTTTAGDHHVPKGVAVVEGELERIGDGGVTIKVAAWRNEKGRPLEGGAKTLFLPMSKVDHVDILEG